MSEIRIHAEKSICTGGPMVPCDFSGWAFKEKGPFHYGYVLDLEIGDVSLHIFPAYPDKIMALGRKLIEIAENLESLGSIQPQ